MVRIQSSIKPAKVLFREGPATVYKAQSQSRSGAWHYVLVFQDQRGIICTCEGFQYQGTCWHTTSVPLCKLIFSGAPYQAECHFTEGHEGKHSWEIPVV